MKLCPFPWSNLGNNIVDLLLRHILCWVIVEISGFLEIGNGVDCLSFRRSPASYYFHDVDASTCSGFVIKLRLVGHTLVIKTKLASARNVSTASQFLYAEYDEADPRCDPPNMSVVRVFCEKVVNKIICNRFGTCL